MLKALAAMAFNYGQGHPLGLQPCLEGTVKRRWREVWPRSAEEAQAVDPDYAPQSVNTDGWQPTQGAWKTLFDNVTLILCFLHAFLKIRDRTTKAFGEVGQAAHKRVWEAYHAPSKRAFSQRVRRLKEWAEKALPDSAMQSHTLDLCNKRAQFMQSYDHLGAHRTSNMVDRLMQFLIEPVLMANIFMGRSSPLRAGYERWDCCGTSARRLLRR